MTEPFALDDARLQLAAARRHTEPPKRAMVMPAKHFQKPFEAELLGRVGNGKVKVRMAGGSILAVDRFRLHGIDKPRDQPRPRLAVDQLDALPWLGAGRDPLLPSEMTR